jgi:hypothetical protein
MRRILVAASGVLNVLALAWITASSVPQLSAAQNLQTCPTQPAIVCVALTVTPGASPTLAATPTVTTSATATATPTEVLDPTPTQIIRGTPGPVRYGIYSPYSQQRVRSCPKANDQECPRVAWIGGGSHWAVWDENYDTPGQIWLFIEDRARFISGWIALVINDYFYGVYTLDQ